MNRTALALLAITLMAVCPARGQEAGRAPQEVLDLLAAAGGMDRYPDANQIIVHSVVDVEYETSGAFVLESYELAKLLTIKGCKDAREQRFPYHRRYGSVEIPVARVIKQDGTVVDVGEDGVTDGTMPEVAQMNIFESDLRQRVVTFPNLEVGDAIEYRMRLEFEPLIKHHFSQEMPLQGREPVRHLEIRIMGPKKMPLYHRIFNGRLEVEAAQDGKKNRYRWVVRDAEPIIPEVGMVDLSEVALKLAVTTDTSWVRLSEYAYDLYGPRIKADRKIKAKVRELTEGLRSDQERIRAIQHYVSSTVRYLGVAMDRGAFIEPHKASYTFEKQYGVCRDVSVLAVAMLAEAGIPAEVVFVNPQKRTEPEIPTLNFMHAVVGIPDGSGGYRYIDPTLMQNTALVGDAQYLSDRNVLHAVKGGADLRRVPHYRPEESLGQTVAHSILGVDGTLTSEVSILGAGFYDLILRMIAGSANSAQLELFWQEFLSASLPGADLVAFATSDPADLSAPMQFDFTVEIQNHTIRADPYLLVSTLLARTELQILNLIFERITELPERIYPVRIGAPVGFEETETLILPRGYRVRSLPDRVMLEEGAFRMLAEYTPKTGRSGVESITYHRRLLIDDRTLDPDEYGTLKRIMRQMERSTKGEIVLARLGGGPGTSSP